MCGPEGPTFLELEEIPWRKYQCQACGHTFRIYSKTPRCPECRSGDLREL